MSFQTTRNANPILNSTNGGAVPLDVFAEFAQIADRRQRQPATARQIFDVAVVDTRTLLRECFSNSLEQLQADIAIHHYGTLDELVQDSGDKAAEVQIVLCCLDWRKAKAAETLRQVSDVVTAIPGIGIIVVADIEDIEDITALIQAGARGYISNSDPLKVALQAMYLVRAGGVYIPANVVMWSSKMMKEMSQSSQRRSDLNLTPRQLSVADSLRRGKANKLIAYELNMCESTVKVHIRTIMKKLKARNRTEAAFIINRLLDSDSRA